MTNLPHAVIFDMDGVIIDSEPLHERAQHIVFARNRLEVPSHAYSEFKGQTEEDVFTYVVREFGNSTHDKHRLISEKHAVYDSLMNEMRMIEGAFEFIELLAGAGHRLAVTTSAIRANQQRVFQRFGLSEYFEVVVTAEDVTRPKPNPQPYLITASRLGVAPQECLVIEDSINGVRSALGAGCDVIALTTSFGAEMLRAAGARVVLDTFADLQAAFSIG